VIEGSDKEKNEKWFLEYITVKGPLFAFILSVIFNIYIQVRELLTVEAEELRTDLIYYSILFFMAIFFFLILLLLDFYRKKQVNLKRKNKFRIIEENDEFDIQELADEKATIICKQNLNIQAMEDHLVNFPTFYPLYGKKPKEFQHIGGNPDRVNISSYEEEYDGVKIFLDHPFAQKETDKINDIIWEYRDYSVKKSITTSIIRRPTDYLTILVKLPASEPKPKKMGWYVINLEGGAVGEKNKIYEVKYDKHEKRYCLSHNFKKVKEGYKYAIWWN
jgi:hypothetical protein